MLLLLDKILSRMLNHQSPFLHFFFSNEIDNVRVSMVPETLQVKDPQWGCGQESQLWRCRLGKASFKGHIYLKVSGLCFLFDFFHFFPTSHLLQNRFWKSFLPDRLLSYPKTSLVFVNHVTQHNLCLGRLNHFSLFEAVEERDFRALKHLC